MLTKVLYVFDDSADVRNLTAQLKSGQKIFLCPLTACQKFVDGVENTIKTHIPVEIERVPFLERFDQRAFAEKNNFLKFISEFAGEKIFKGQNVKERLACPGGSFSLWWLSLVAEKNPLKSDSYTNLIKLLTVLDLYKETGSREICIDIKSAELADALTFNLRNGCDVRNFRNCRLIPDGIYGLLHFVKGWWRFGVILFKSLYAKMSLRNSKDRQNQLSNSRYLLVTYFPFVDEEKWDGGGFVNKFYGPLQNSLEKKYPGKISWLAMTVDTARYKFAGSVRLGREINARQPNLFFLEEMLCLTCAARMFGQFILMTAKFISIKRPLKASFLFGEEKVYLWPLFRKEFYSSFSGTRLAEGLYYYHAFRNLGRQLTAGTTAVYFAEMQAWEKALNIALRENDGTTVVGFQHAILSVLHLMYFTHTEDLKDGNFIDRMPRPHFLASVGEISLKLFRDSGWPKEKTFALGPVRFQNFRELVICGNMWDEKTNDVIVALSISPLEAREILHYVYEAFGDKPEIKVLIKAHPFCPVDPLKKSLNGYARLSHIQFVDTSLEELLKPAKVLIVAESSAAIEAIACQCRVIVPKLTSVIDMNPLSGTTDLGTVVYSPRQMAEEVQRILENPAAENYGGRCRDFIEKYCAFVETDEEFVTRLEKATGRRVPA